MRITLTPLRSSTTTTTSSTASSTRYTRAGSAETPAPAATPDPGRIELPALTRSTGLLTGPSHVAVGMAALELGNVRRRGFYPPSGILRVYAQMAAAAAASQRDGSTAVPASFDLVF